MKVVGIDASNIKSGGGLTHLKSILDYLDINQSELTKIIVWSNNITLDYLPNRPYIIKRSHFFLNRGLLLNFLFQFFFLKREADKLGCDIIFVPGGTFISNFKPFVAMSQNMLPFEKEEAIHYGFLMRLRLKVLYYTQTYTFKRAEAVLFLTRYAKDYIQNRIGLSGKKIEIVPHGVDSIFQQKPKVQMQPESYYKGNSFELLYVSYITVYKHQWNVAEAVCQLNEIGYPIKLKLIGSVLDSFEKLDDVLKKYKNSKECIEFIPGLTHDQLKLHYKSADAFVFASSCENQPIILLEAMSAGLPIISSSLGPMGEMLGDSSVFFNPRSVPDIVEAIKVLFNNPDLRSLISKDVYNKASKYTWSNCSSDTFKILVKIASNFKMSKECAE